MLHGVKTGCPLSSLLFLLCVNPFIDIINELSDNPGFSVTRVCADDFGSTLDQLYRIKCQASVFRLAASLAGLHLKPCECVIIVSCIPISDAIANAIKAWLADNVPDFEDFLIASSAKSLGWFLGVGSSKLSWQEPLQKVTGRVEEIVSANAPATTAILRFNRRAVPVLSFVSQFSHPPVCADLPKLDQWNVHKLLRIPSSCMSRNLWHSVSFCTDMTHSLLFHFASLI